MISWTCAEETNKFKPSLSWRTKNDWHWKWQTELKIRQKTKGGANETVSVCDRDWWRIWIWERVFCVGKTCSERERERGCQLGIRKWFFTAISESCVCSH